jgi:hypothetical protein
MSTIKEKFSPGDMVEMGSLDMVIMVLCQPPRKFKLERKS